MVKVVATCVNGLGSSLLMKTKLEKVFKKLGIPAEVQHMSLSEAKRAAPRCDFIFCSSSIVDQFSSGDKGAKIVGLLNIMSESEMESKLKAIIGNK